MMAETPDDLGRMAAVPGGADEQPGRTRLVVVGLNHRTAPVELRERIAFNAGNLPAALREMRGLPGVAEAAVLSTCNRCELYAAADNPAVAIAELSAFLAEFHGLRPADLAEHLYRHEDPAAARHLFRVAAGIDSMVLGEGQILGQVKAAFRLAAETRTARAFLHELFQRALHVGKRARTTTGIHRGAVSISSAAVDLATSVFGNLTGREALVIGAGEMSEQTLKHLVDHGVASVIVANRTFDRAVDLAGRYAGRAVTFDDFPGHLRSADIIISSSAAPHPIVTVDKLRPVLAARRGRPLFIVDIAVPRDVEPEVADLPNVYLFDIDDLDQVAERYRAERAREVVKVEGLIEEELTQFAVWLDTRTAKPLIVELRERVEAVRDAELERWLRRLPDLTEAEREVVRQMMRSFGNKILHGPLVEIRKGSGSEEESNVRALVRRLFDLGGSGDES